MPALSSRRGRPERQYSFTWGMVACLSRCAIVSRIMHRHSVRRATGGMRRGQGSQQCSRTRACVRR